MAQVIVTMKLMPDSPDTPLLILKDKAKIMIENFGGEIGKSEEEPVAFGLKALVLYFVMEEALGSTEELEKEISEITGVTSVEVVDVRRAIG